MLDEKKQTENVRLGVEKRLQRWQQLTLQGFSIKEKEIKNWFQCKNAGLDFFSFSSNFEFKNGIFIKFEKTVSNFLNTDFLKKMNFGN